MTRRGPPRSPPKAPDHVSLSLLEAGERVAKLGTWEWFPTLDKLIWSNNLYRIFGLEPGAITPELGFVVAQVHADDRDRVAAYIELVRTNDALPPIEFRIHQHGTVGVRFVRSTVTSVDAQADAGRHMIGILQDVTDQRGADRELRAHLALSDALEAWEQLGNGAESLVRSLGEAMEFVVGVLWLPEADRLIARVVWSDPSLEGSEQFEVATRGLHPKRGVGVPGRAWQAAAPIGVANVLSDRDYRRRHAASASGIQGAVAFPAIHLGDVLAVLEFYYREESQPTARLMRTLGAIGHELGEFLSRRTGQLRAPALTPRELEVLQLAADGHSGREIAELLNISPTTIATHMKNIYVRLGVSDRAAAVAAALRLGLIS